MKEHILFNISIVIINKGIVYKIPEDAVKHRTIHSISKIDAFMRDYLNHVDFEKQNVIIIYRKSAEAIIRDRINELYRLIEDVTGVDKLEIRSKDQDGPICFARQLFHYGFMHLKIDILRAAGEETNNTHATVLHSIKEMTENIQSYKKSWRIRLLRKFKRKLNKL